MQGYAPAAHNLGAMAANGEGTPQSYAQAYKWLLLSEKLGTTADTLYKEKFRTTLSKDKQAEIQTQVKEIYEHIKDDYKAPLPSLKDEL
jgi:TPR repeat protein